MLRNVRLLACNDLQVDDSGDVFVQTDGGLVAAHRLDVLGQFDLALVDVAEAGGLDGVGDVGLLDGAEQAARTRRP